MWWSRFVLRYRFVAAATGLGILLAVTAPLLGVHFGLPIPANCPGGSATGTRAT
jgi:hypothetical protein